MKCVLCGAETGESWKTYCYPCYKNRHNNRYLENLRQEKFLEIKPTDNLIIKAMKFMFQPEIVETHMRGGGTWRESYPRILAWPQQVLYFLALLPLMLLFVIAFFPIRLVENKFNFKKALLDSMDFSIRPKADS